MALSCWKMLLIQSHAMANSNFKVDFSSACVSHAAFTLRADVAAVAIFAMLLMMMRILEEMIRHTYDSLHV